VNGSLVHRLVTSDGVAAWTARLLVMLVAAVPLAVFLFEAAAGLRSANDSVELFSFALLARTLLLAAVVAVLSGLVGGFCGAVAGRLSRPAALVSLFAFVMPLAAPPMFHAYVWRNAALGAGLLGGLFVEGGSAYVNFVGAAVSMVAAFWTIPALAAFAVAAGPARRYELEARPFVSPAIAARRILLPAIFPAVVAAAALVFILAFGEYGCAAIWQVNTYPAHVLSICLGMFDSALAASASLVPALVTGLVAVGAFFIASRALARTGVERANVPAETLWRASSGMKTLFASAALLLVGLPAALCIWWAASAWTGLAALGGIFQDLGFTALFACASGLVAAIIAALAAGSHWIIGARWRTAIAVIALGAFLLPAAGAGLAVKRIASLGFVPTGFGDTPMALVFAHAGRFMAIPLLLSLVALSRVGDGYKRLAEISGARGFRGLAAVGLPLVFPAALAGFAVAVVLSVAELPIALLVSPPGRPPVSVDLFNLMHYARQSEALTVALAMSVVSSVGVLAVLLVSQSLWTRYLPTT
jgi:iron(III) transport system permease protein